MKVLFSETFNCDIIVAESEDEFDKLSEFYAGKKTVWLVKEIEYCRNEPKKLRQILNEIKKVFIKARVEV